MFQEICKPQAIIWRIMCEHRDLTQFSGAYKMSSDSQKGQRPLPAAASTLNQI